MGDADNHQSIKAGFYRELQEKQPNKIYGYQALRASHYMGLSLFIILLAFFIALTAMSDIQPQKSQPVLNSIQSTFAPNILAIDPLRLTSSQDEGRGASNNGISPAEALSQAFGQAPHDIRLNLNFDPVDETKLLSADIDTRYVVLENYAVSLSRSLKKVIEKSNQSQPFSIEIWLPKKVMTSEEDMKRVGALYNKFMRQAFPPKAMRLVLSEDLKGPSNARIRLVLDPSQSSFGRDAVMGKDFLPIGGAE